MNECYVDMVIDDEAIKVLEDAVLKSLPQVADFIVGDTIQNQYIPYNNGILQNSRYIRYDEQSKSAYIRHNVPYDIYVYNGDHMNFQKGNNHNARSRWYKEYEEQGQHFEKVERFFASRIKANSERYVE